MAKRLLPGWLILVSALCGAASLGAQSGRALAGSEIREIEYRGLITLAEDSMGFFLGIEVGDRLDPDRLNQHIHEFWERDLVDDVQVEAEPLDGGVKLIVSLVERPILRSLDYQGNKKVKRSEIGDAVDKERIELFEDTPLNIAELVRLKKAIEGLYTERGYRFAEVTFDVEQINPSDRRVLVTIDEGDKVRIGQVLFEGNEVFRPSRLRRQMKKTKESSIISRIRKRNIYNPATVAEDMDAVKKLYRDFGYKDVQLGEPVIEVITKNQQIIEEDAPLPESAGRRSLRLIIPIEEGARWRLGEVRFEGNTIADGAALASVFDQPKGGWLRADVVDKGLEQIKEFYNNSGYLFAEVQKELVEREDVDLVADVLIKIEENDQFKVGRLEFSGNSRTRDRVLRRELRLQESMVFNSAALKNSLLKLNQLEYFKLNEDDPVTVTPDVENKSVDVTVNGEESERTELQFGGGFSEIDGFFGQASIRTRNFLGRGETLAVSFQSGRFRDIFDVSYFVPWFLDRPQSFGLQLFDRQLNYDLLIGQEFQRSERGAVATWGRSFRLFESFSVAYTLADLRDFQSQRISDQDTLSRSFEFRKSSVTGSYRYDSHDSRLEPTRGTRLSASLEYAGGPLGGGNYFVRPAFNFAWTRPLSNKGLRTVGRVNLDFQLIEAFGTEDNGRARQLFFNDRLLLGGENSIRGFNFRSIWMRDNATGLTITDANGFPQGGVRSGFLNLEHHIIVNGPFRIITFFDAGNVWGEGQPIDLEALKMVAGLELRITVPIFGAPLRFIWSNNLNPLDGLTGINQERFQSFDFSIGVSF